MTTASQKRRERIDAAVVYDYVVKEKPIAEIISKYGIARQTIYAIIERRGFSLRKAVKSVPTERSFEIF